MMIAVNTETCSFWMRTVLCWTYHLTLFWLLFWVISHTYSPPFCLLFLSVVYFWCTCVCVFVCWSNSSSQPARPHVNTFNWIGLKYQYIMEQTLSLSLFIIFTLTVIMLFMLFITWCGLLLFFATCFICCLTRDVCTAVLSLSLSLPGLMAVVSAH
jgi:hypothetical protein